MPRAKHLDTLARQWELLKLLPSRRPGRTTRDLRDSLATAGHTVTKRTVERDLVELSRLFPLECNDVSKPYGWYWMPGAQLDIPGIDLAEALSLGLLENLLRQLVPQPFGDALKGRFVQAAEKLRALSDNPHAQWTDLVRYVPAGLPFLPPEILPGVLDTVHGALLRWRQIRVSYLGSQSTEAKEHHLHPLALIQQGVRSYVLARTSKHESPVLYAIHRIQSAEILDEPAQRPDGFSLDRFLAEGGAQFGEGERIILKARIGEDLAVILRETPISDDQKITTRKGIHTLTATVFDSWQLEFWILSCGPRIEVLKPGPLRKRVASMLRRPLDQYRPRKTSPNPK